MFFNSKTIMFYLFLMFAIFIQAEGNPRPPERTNNLQSQCSDPLMNTKEQHEVSKQETLIHSLSSESENLTETHSAELEDALKKLGLPTHPVSRDTELVGINEKADYALDFREVWSSSSSNRNILQVFANNVDIIRRSRAYAPHSPEDALINIILRVIQWFNLKEHGSQIPEQLENVIYSLDQIPSEKMDDLYLILDRELKILSDPGLFSFKINKVLSIETSDEVLAPHGYTTNKKRKAVFESSSNYQQINMERKYIRERWQFVKNGQIRRTFTAIPLPTQGLPDKISLIESEAELKDKGFSDEDIAGLDETKSSLQLANSLRNRSIDPHTSHIPEFAENIDEYIRFIERGIRNLAVNQRESSIHQINQMYRLALLEDFKVEAQRRQNLETITYRWWLNFVFRLSILVTDSLSSSSQRALYSTDFPFMDHLYNKRSWVTNEALEDLHIRFPDNRYSTLLDVFPDFILIPTISNLGKIAISRTYQTGVHLVQLVNQERFGIDPHRFLVHDYDHAWKRWQQVIQERERRFDHAFIYKVRYFPTDQRLFLETLYYHFNHEIGRLTYRADRSIIQRMISLSTLRADYLNRRYPFALDGHIPPDDIFAFGISLIRAWNNYRQLRSDIESELGFELTDH